MWYTIGGINNLNLSPGVKLPLHLLGLTIYPFDKSPYKNKVFEYLKNSHYNTNFSHIIVRRTKKIEETNGRFFNESIGKFNAFFAILRVVKTNNSFVRCEFFFNNGNISVFSSRESNEFPHFISRKNDTIITRNDILIAKKIFQSIRKRKKQSRLNKMLNSLGYLENGCKGATLAERIIWLFVALEAIFNLNEPELTFKLSSRAAWYLYPTNINRRIATFKGLKKAYHFRSEIVHGEILKDEDVKKHLSFLENIIWSLMRKILLDKIAMKFLTSNKDVAGEYLNGISLGK